MQTMPSSLGGGQQAVFLGSAASNIGNSRRVSIESWGFSFKCGPRIGDRFWYPGAVGGCRAPSPYSIPILTIFFENVLICSRMKIIFRFAS